MSNRPGRSLIGGIVKVAAILVGIMGFLASVYQFSPFWNGTERFDKYFIVVVVLLLIAVFIIKQYIDKKEAEKKVHIEHIKTHAYAHYLRDTTYEAQKLSNGETNDMAMRRLLQAFADNTVKCIHEILCTLTDTDVNSSDLMVSVKVLEFAHWNNISIIDKDKVRYRTLSRSLVPQGDLKADDEKFHEIGECTAFSSIFTEVMHDWTGVNLSREKSNIEIVTKQRSRKGFCYADTCSTYKHYYNNKIVVPIRVELKKMDDSYEGKDDRNLFGFVCVEYKERKKIPAKSEFDETLINFCDLLKTFADTMYLVFDSIYSHMSYGNPEEKDLEVS